MKLSIILTICGVCFLSGCTSTTAMLSPEAQAQKTAEEARATAEIQLHDRMVALLTKSTVTTAPTSGIMATN